MSALTIVLCLFSIVLYAMVTSLLARDIDKALALRAEGVAESVFAFWRAERASAGFGPGNWPAAPSNTFAEERVQGQPSDLLSRWADKTKQLDTEHPIRLLSNDGQPLGASHSFTQLALPVSQTAVAHVRRGRHIYETFRLPDRRIRLITHPVLEGGQVLYVIQVATGLEDKDTTLLRLRFLLLLLIPTTLIGVGVVGALLAKTALQPIRQAMTQMREFVAEHLHEQVEAPQRRDEPERLSAAFNEILGRLNWTFRRLRQFSAAAAHEQRTALTVMKGELDVTLRRPRKVEEYRRFLTRQLETINDIIQASEELLRLAQWEAAEEGIQQHGIELSELVQRTSSTFRPVADQKSVHVALSTNGPVWVQGESRLLERVIANLLDNAIKHTPVEGHVTLRVEPQGNQACLIIRDTGPGIPADQLPVLFDRFFKRKPTTEETHSFGLGLGLCRWIIEAHHGQIDVTSAPGQGATFTVSLPLAARPPA